MTNSSDRRGRVILAVWIAGFLVGTVSHIADLAAGGLDTYARFPAALRVFWAGLTVLDPLVIAILAMRRRAGIVLALAVILADIAVNWTVLLTISGNPLYGAIDQTVFAAILAVTTPILWRWFPTRPRARRRRRPHGRRR